MEKEEKRWFFRPANGPDCWFTDAEKAAWAHQTGFAIGMDGRVRENPLLGSGEFVGTIVKVGG